MPFDATDVALSILKIAIVLLAILTGFRAGFIATAGSGSRIEGPAASCRIDREARFLQEPRGEAAGQPGTWIPGAPPGASGT